MEEKDIENLSLKGLKAFVQVCRAMSPEMKILKEDLKEIIKVLEKASENHKNTLGKRLKILYFCRDGLCEKTKSKNERRKHNNQDKIPLEIWLCKSS